MPNNDPKPAISWMLSTYVQMWGKALPEEHLDPESWTSRQFSPREVARWLDADVWNAQVAAHLRDAGITPDMLDPNSSYQMYLGHDLEDCCRGLITPEALVRFIRRSLTQ